MKYLPLDVKQQSIKQLDCFPSPTGYSVVITTISPMVPAPKVHFYLYHVYFE